MEKLSGILPSSSRVTSVDVSDSPPARPGAPVRGMKLGTNSVRDRISLSPQAKELAASQTLVGKKAKEVSQSKAISELNRRFFETRLNPIETRVPGSEQVAIQTNEQLIERAPIPPVEVEDFSPMPESGNDSVNESMNESKVTPYSNLTSSHPRVSLEA